MRTRMLAAAVAALLVPAAPALGAGDPIMPLSQVHAGLRCTAYSVVRGTDISSFDAEVLDVVDGDASNGTARILIQVSGPAVDATGLGPGFSGSPIYCPDADGVSRNIGAISESVGEYGGRVALATPIEQIVGTPIDVPTKPAAASDSGRASVARALWAKGLRDHARPLAAPVTIGGVSDSVARALAVAGQKAGRIVLAAPAGPLASFPKQTLRPGSAVATAYSSGDLRVSAIGTVSYVDGENVWAFGHPLEDVGRRALLLQDAYVFRVINNPVQLGAATTYKLASSGHDVGMLTNDAENAVAGRTGALPHTVPVSVLARDTTTGATRALQVRVADEEAVDIPSGGSWLSAVGPLAVVQAATSVLGSTPARVTGRMCARIELAQVARPLRFCNRYVSAAQEQADDGSLGNAVTTGAASDLAGALARIDAYTGKPPRITSVSVLLQLRRGADQAFLRHISAPARVRPGQRVRLQLTLRQLRGNEFRRSYTVRIPSGLRSGNVRLRLIGRDADSGNDGLGTTIIIGDDSGNDGGGDPGPASLAELADQVRGMAGYDGVTLRMGAERERAFRDPDFRISGRADATVRVVRR